MLAYVLAVENDLVPIDAADGDVALGRGDDVPAGYVPAASTIVSPGAARAIACWSVGTSSGTRIWLRTRPSRRGSGGNEREERRGYGDAAKHGLARRPRWASRAHQHPLERGRGAEPAAVRPLALPCAWLRVRSATGFAYG